MGKRFFALVLAMVTAVFCMTGCLGGAPSSAAPAAPGAASGGGESSSGAEAGGDTVQLRFNCNLSESDLEMNPGGIGVQAMVDEMLEISHGAAQVDLYLGSILGSGTDAVLSGAKAGSYEIFNLSPGNFGGYTTAFAPLNIPYLFKNQGEVEAFLDSSLMAECEENLRRDTGMIVLGYLHYGFRQVTNNRGPIKKPGDMAGLKIRTMSDKYQIATFEAFGASPTTTAYSEMFTSLQQGLIDAQENPLTTMYASGVQEVQKYCTITNHSYTVSAIYIYEDTYNALSPEVQEALRKGAQRAEEVSAQYVGIQEQWVRDQVEGKYLEVTDLSDEEFEAFRDEVIEKVWPVISESLGKEYFDRIVDEVEKIEAAQA